MQTTLTMLAESTSVESLTQFGVAGLMGLLWLFERLYSRQRERELSQAHQQLLAQQQELRVLIELVERNTVAYERFEKTEQHLAELIDRLIQTRQVA